MDAPFSRGIPCRIEVSDQDGNVGHVFLEVLDEMFVDEALTELQRRAGVIPSSYMVKYLVPKLSCCSILSWNWPIRGDDHKVLLGACSKVETSDNPL